MSVKSAATVIAAFASFALTVISSSAADFFEELRDRYLIKSATFFR